MTRTIERGLQTSVNKLGPNSLVAERFRKVGDRRVVQTVFEVVCPVAEELHCTIKALRYKGTPHEGIEVVAKFRIVDYPGKNRVVFDPDCELNEVVEVKIGGKAIPTSLRDEEWYVNQIEVSFGGIVMRTASMLDADNDWHDGMLVEINGVRTEFKPLGYNLLRAKDKAALSPVGPEAI